MVIQNYIYILQDFPLSSFNTKLYFKTQTRRHVCLYSEYLKRNFGEVVRFSSLSHQVPFIPFLGFFLK